MLRHLRLAVATIAGVLTGLAALGEAAGSDLVELHIEGRVIQVEPKGDWALVRTDSGREQFVRTIDGSVELWWYTEGTFDVETPADLLPQSRVAPGEWDVGAAWLSEATDRYDHGVLGDRLEAASLMIRRRDRSIERVHAGDDAVFEDLLPRLVDLDGDRSAEILVVKSYLDRGAALAVIGRDGDGALAILDETPPIGRANRWLNPVGAADFDGDGRIEIAYVETPHIGGTLMIWEWRDGRLEREHAEPGFSNHAIGSTELGLSAIADVDGDGLLDLAVPGRRRDRLRLISLAGARFRDLADIALDGRIATAIAPVGDHFVFGLEDGRLIALRPRLR